MEEQSKSAEENFQIPPETEMNLPEERRGKFVAYDRDTGEALFAVEVGTEIETVRVDAATLEKLNPNYKGPAAVPANPENLSEVGEEKE